MIPERYKGKLFCFSPPVMLATFSLEICLALYAWLRYRLTPVSRLVVAMLCLLAVFQLAEYMVCGGLGLSSMSWARVGYVAITVLPPVGIHLIYAIAGKRPRWFVGGSYLAAVGFMGYFLLADDVFTGSQCLGNYVIFQLGAVAAQLYTFYYYGLLLSAIALCLYFASTSEQMKRRRALHGFAAGYVLFMLPTTIVNTIDPATLAGIPSIMCGFAVILAAIVTLWVLPAAGVQMQRSRR